MKVTTLGIDVAKSICQLHGGNEHGQVALQKRVTRGKLLETVAQLPPCVIGMEACGSAQDDPIKLSFKKALFGIRLAPCTSQTCTPSLPREAKPCLGDTHPSWPNCCLWSCPNWSAAAR